MEKITLAKASSHIGSDKAIGRLPRFSGKSPPAVRTMLINHGFHISTTSANGSEIYVHPDGSQVRIDPAHRPINPKINQIDGKPMMSHIRAHYHKLWTDGANTLSLDDQGYVVDFKTSNAHVPAGRKRNKAKTKEAEFEPWLFEAAFPSKPACSMGLSSTSSYGNLWLFEFF